MDINSLQDTCQNQKELDIFIRCFTGVQKVHSIICSNRPVIMFTGTIYTGEGLFIQKTSQAVTLRHLFHGFHDYLVMIHRDICSLIYRSQLVLRGSHFVMLCLGRYAQLPQFYVQILHESADTFSDNTEVMIFQLLSLRSRCPEQGTSRKNQILSL